MFLILKTKPTIKRREKGGGTWHLWGPDIYLAFLSFNLHFLKHVLSARPLLPARGCLSRVLSPQIPGCWGDSTTHETELQGILENSCEFMMSAVMLEVGKITSQTKDQGTNGHKGLYRFRTFSWL